MSWFAPLKLHSDCALNVRQQFRVRRKFSDLHRAFRDSGCVLAGRLSGFSRGLRNDPSAFGFRAGLSGASLHAP